MTTRFYSLFVGLLYLSIISINAQNCPTGDITFDTQAAIDDFVDDTNNCTIIEGNVMISGSDITSLSGLSEVALIKGSLTIQLTNLLNFNGLDDLEKIEGGLSIKFNNSLVNLEGLGSLLTLDGIFQVESNGALIDFAGIDNLLSFGSAIQISSNQNLESLAGITYPECLPGFDLSFCGKITDLNALIGVDTIKGELSISNMDALESLSGLDSVKVIEDRITLIDNPLLQDFSGLKSLKSIDERFLCRRNHSIHNFNGLDALERIGGLFEIKENDSLENFVGLGNLEQIEGRVTILENLSLLSFTGLSNLKQIYGDVEITENDTLLTFAGLTQLDSIGGDVEIRLNPFLRSLNGLNQLTHISGPFTISANDSLMSVEALANLQIIEGKLSVTNNVSLESLRGFNNVDPELVSDLVVRGNIALSECQASAICAYLDAAESDQLYDFEINAPGCNTAMEVQDLCQNAPLPVELLYFTGELVDRVSRLQWSTASEYNNDGFAVERSSDGSNWAQIGFVNGQGSTNQLSNYHFTDRQPFYGENYYRLRQMNFNGSFDFSEVIVLRNESQKLELEAYPNPSDDIVTVNISNPEEADMTLMVHDYLGRTIFEMQLNQQSNWNQEFQFDTKGMYFITLNAGQTIYRKKVMYTGGQ